MARDKGVLQNLDLVYENRESGDKADDARERQSGHCKRTEEMIYGRLLMESPFHTMSERQEFRKVSADWHRILGFQSAWEEGYIDPNTRRRVQAEQEQEEFQRWSALRKTDLKRQLKRLVGPEAEFRGLQRAGLEAIMQRQLRVLIIMRTGGGKSIFFMLPAASTRTGVTMVIIPLNSLREDLKDRCDKAGISCAEWDGQRPPHWASIVLATPEAAVSTAFGRFIDEKRAMKQLDRIVIDECHVVLDSDNKWRPGILKLVEMAEKQTQLVYLTATLPPRNEIQFYEAMGLDGRDVVKFREKTTRTNVEYRVHLYERGREDDEVRSLVEEKKKQYPMPGQIIVYCKEIAQAKRVAKAVGCSVYYHDMGTDAKKRILRQLTNRQE